MSNPLYQETGNRIATATVVTPGKLSSTFF